MKNMKSSKRVMLKQTPFKNSLSVFLHSIAIYPSYNEQLLTYFIQILRKILNFVGLPSMGQDGSVTSYPTKIISSD